MKKIISLFLLILACTIFPSNIVHANTVSVPPTAQQSTLLKERREGINDRVKHNRKIQNEINKKSKRAADLYLIAFGRSSVPSEADAKKAEVIEAQLGRIAEEAILVEQQITLKVRLATEAFQQGNYALALSHYDSLISLLDKQTDILKGQNEYLQSYVDFLSSLKHK